MRPGGEGVVSDRTSHIPLPSRPGGFEVSGWRQRQGFWEEVREITERLTDRKEEWRAAAPRFGVSREG